MKKYLLSALVVAIVFGNAAIAQRLPSYYPSDGFQHTGVVDAIYLQEDRIVIGDTEFLLADSVVLHSLSYKSDSIARLRVGAYVGFSAGADRVISELWLLPRNHKDKD